MIRVQGFEAIPYFAGSTFKPSVKIGVHTARVV